MLQVADLAQNRYDNKVSNLIALYFVIYGFNAIIGLLFANTLLESVAFPFFSVIYLIYFLFSINLLKRASSILICLELLFSIFMILGITVNGHLIGLIIKKGIWMLAFCIPFFVLVLSINDINILFQKLQLVANFIFIQCILIFLFRQRIIHDYTGNYDMTFSYLLLLPTIIFLEKGWKRPVFWGLALLAIILNIIYGTRGALVCIGIYGIYTVYHNLSSRFKIFICSLGILFLVIFEIAGSVLLALFEDLYRQSGITSRTLDMLFNHTLFNLTNRDELYVIAISKISEKPLLGWGIAGEYNFLDTYPHNIFLESAIHFGFFSIAIVTLIISISVFILFLKKKVHTCFWMFLCLGFLPLLISSTYLQKPEFWIWLALACKGLFALKHNKILLFKN